MPIGAFAEKMNRRDYLARLRVKSLLHGQPPPSPGGRQQTAGRGGGRVPPPKMIVFALIPAGTYQPPRPALLCLVDRPNVPVTLKISAGGKSAIRSRRIILDERPIQQNAEIGPVAQFDEQVPLNGLVPKRQVRLAVEATNAAGEQRTETIDVVYRPPPPVAPPPDKVAVQLPGAAASPRRGCTSWPSAATVSPAPCPPLGRAGRDAGHPPTGR